MKYRFFAILLVLSVLTSFFKISAQNSTSDSTFLVYKIDIKKEIGNTTWLYIKNGFDEAEEFGADHILIHMNTYGGQVIHADSIRTKILNTKTPVSVFIDNNAASAGALISIACDNIFMRPGANIGAATVVNQSGEKMPDKYQSYMRATIRSTAESHGKDTVITGADTTYVWKRDPRIAEAMVDESFYIEGIIDTGKILTFTANEALKHGYCEGLADNVKEVIEERLSIKEYELKSYEITAYDNIKGFLTGPVLQGILIMLIVGGIYFELQSPGIGFPLAISILAGILYLAPLYLDGLAANWEIIIFILGVVLVAVEVFVIPGFGIAGIAGVILVIMGLTLTMVGNFSVEDFEGGDLSPLARALGVVMVSVLVSLITSIWLTKRFWGQGALSKLALDTSESVEDGFVGVPTKQYDLVGKEGVTISVLRPSGKVLVGDDVYDAISELGFIEKDETIIISKYETGQIYVHKK